MPEEGCVLLLHVCLGFDGAKIHSFDEIAKEKSCYYGWQIGQMA